MTFCCDNSCCMNDFLYIYFQTTETTGLQAHTPCSSAKWSLDTATLPRRQTQTCYDHPVSTTARAPVPIAGVSSLTLSWALTEMVETGCCSVNLSSLVKTKFTRPSWSHTTESEAELGCFSTEWVMVPCSGAMVHFSWAVMPCGWALMHCSWAVMPCGWEMMHCGWVMNTNDAL